MGQRGLDSSLDLLEGLSIDSGSLFMIDQTWKRFFFPAIFFFLFAFLSPAQALETPEQILRELDARYYYPQQLGLEKLSLQIDWEQLDVVSDKYLKNPTVDFFWDKGASKGAQGVFTLADPSVEVSLERKRQILGMLQNYQEVLIPQTLVDKLAGYKGNIKIARKSRRLIEFSALKPDADILKYQLLVNLKQKNVRKFQMHRSSAPVEIKTEVRYTQKEGRWLTAESRSTFRMGEMDYSENTEFVYRRIKNFWLIGKVTQTIKADDRIIQSFIFQFRNHKTN